MCRPPNEGKRADRPMRVSVDCPINISVDRPINISVDRPVKVMTDRPTVEEADCLTKVKANRLPLPPLVRPEYLRID